MKKNCMFAALAVIIVCCLSCAQTKSLRKTQDSYLARMTQIAVFEYLKHPNIVHDVIGKGKTKLDPVLCVRDTMTLWNTIYFEVVMRSDSLLYPLPQDSLALVIPDSLSEKYTYTDQEKDYEHDFATIHQFSMLLATKEPPIYLMQHYEWLNTCTTKRCYREASRYYLKFKIEKQRATYLGLVKPDSPDGLDFISFPSFPRELLEEGVGNKR